MTLRALFGAVGIKADFGSSDMVERPKGGEEEEEDATLVFLACLDAAVFLAAATPDETRARAVFSFSFPWVEGRYDFLTMPPDMTVPLRDLWAVVVVGLDEADEEVTGEEMGGMVIVGFRDGAADGSSSSSESSSSPWSVTAEGVSTSCGSMQMDWFMRLSLSMRKGEGEEREEREEEEGK